MLLGLRGLAGLYTLSVMISIQPEGVGFERPHEKQKGGSRLLVEKREPRKRRSEPSIRRHVAQVRGQSCDVPCMCTFLKWLYLGR